MDSPLLSLRNVTQRREKAGAGFSLRVPHLDVFAGEFAAFVGESGCGKSTLLDLLGLVSRPVSADRFHLQLGGQLTDVPGAREDALAALRARHLGYVLQSGGLLAFLSAGENVLLSRRLNGLPATRHDVATLLGRLGIDGQWAKKPAFLSGGQRQRVAIARALAHEPALLLADEPTGAVDKHTAREIRDLLRNAARERGTTVLLVTHDEPLVATLTDRVFTFEVERLSESETRSTLIETSWSGRPARPAA